MTDDILAKNLLVGRTCENCSWSITESFEYREYTYCTKSCSSVNKYTEKDSICDAWTDDIATDVIVKTNKLMGIK